jgi:hypothetical protein
MLRIFASRAVIEAAEARRRLGPDGLPPVDLVADAEAEEEEELAQMEPGFSEPDTTWVVGPDGVAYIMEGPVLQTVQTNAQMIFVVEPSIHTTQSIEAAKVSLKSFLAKYPSVMWMPYMGDAITQQYNLTAAFHDPDLMGKVLVIVGGLHLFKCAGGMIATRLFDLGKLPLFAAVGYHTLGMAEFIINGARLRKLATFLMDCREAFWSQINKFFLCNDSDFLESCSRKGLECNCRTALVIFRHFRAFATESAKREIAVVIDKQSNPVQAQQYGMF